MADSYFGTGKSRNTLGIYLYEVLLWP